MLNKNLFGISGIAAAITGCVIGATIIIKTGKDCRREKKDMKAIMEDIERKSKHIDNLNQGINKMKMDILIEQVILDKLNEKLD